MTQRIGRDEDIAAALIRILNHDLEAAQREFRAGDRRNERVHRARQRLKRIRTILRIVEPQFGERVAELRQTLTRAAQLLAHARDADVAAARARAIAASTAADGEPLGFEYVAETLDREAAEAHRQKTPVGEITMLFATAGATVATLTAHFDGAALLSQALAETYRQGKEAQEEARRSLATGDFHAWRKCAKRLGHLLALARKRLPKAARKLADRLGALDDLLGADNDYALLAERIALMPSTNLSLMSQLSAISRRRTALETRAFGLGEKIYRRGRKSFARRFPLG